MNYYQSVKDRSLRFFEGDPMSGRVGLSPLDYALLSRVVAHRPLKMLFEIEAILVINAYLLRVTIPSVTIHHIIVIES